MCHSPQLNLTRHRREEGEDGGGQCIKWISPSLKMKWRCVCVAWMIYEISHSQQPAVISRDNQQSIRPDWNMFFTIEVEVCVCVCVFIVSLIYIYIFLLCMSYGNRVYIIFRMPNKMSQFIHWLIRPIYKDFGIQCPFDCRNCFAHNRHLRSLLIPEEVAGAKISRSRSKDFYEPYCM